jgi:hypothetical protein
VVDAGVLEQAPEVDKQLDLGGYWLGDPLSWSICHPQDPAAKFFFLCDLKEGFVAACAALEFRLQCSVETLFCGYLQVFDCAQQS